jgi:hypothetical protein
MASRNSRTLLALAISAVLPGSPLLLRGQVAPAAPTAAVDQTIAEPNGPAQGSATGDSSSAPLHLKWISIGFRVPVSLEQEISSRTIQTSTSSPQTTTTFTTTRGSEPKTGLALALEFPLRGRFTLTNELRLHHASYTQEHKYVQGDPSSSSSTKATWTERTKVSEWEFPLMLRFTGFGSDRILSKFYISGGGIFRLMTNVRTGTDYVLDVPNKDEVTDYNEIRTTPAHRNLVGGTFALGFRFMDEFHIRVTPEIRYIRWPDRNFDSHSTKSNVNQVEVGVALTF